MKKIPFVAGSTRSNITASSVSAIVGGMPLRYSWLRWGVLALGVASSLGGAYFYRQEVGYTAQAEFHALAIGKTSEIALRTRAYADVLYALRGLFDASAAVTRSDFHQFAGAFSLAERYPGLNNISYAPLVSLAQKRVFEHAVRAENSELTRDLPEFSIKPPGDRPEYIVLHYVEPLRKHLPGWGLDLLFDPSRRAAVERARATGAITSVSGITLMRDGKAPIPSTLLKLAVYRGGGVPDSEAERQRLFSGVAGSTLRIGELVEATLKPEVLARMRVRIFAGADAAAANSPVPAEQPLYDSLPADRAILTHPDYAAYAVSQDLAVGDRMWSVVITPLVDPIDAFDYATVAGVLTASLALAGLLFWLMSSLATVQRHGLRLGQRGREAALLTSLGEDLHSCKTIPEACHVLATQMPGLLPPTSGVLYVIDASHTRANAAAQWGAPENVAVGFALHDCQSARRGHLFLADSAATSHSCCHFTGNPPDSYVCMPLIAEGEMIGILHVQHRPGDNEVATDGEAELNIIKATAQHLALALANLGLREKLFERATRDNLTGLYNRHYMREWFEQELLRAGRHRRSVGMILVDVDHFKQVNDNFGHDAGDMVLRELAAVLRRVARGSDVACRHGGEEFLLLMPEATLEGTLGKAEKLRQEIEGLALAYGKQELSITISAGVAIYPDHGADVDALLRAADEALYAAKGAGRNRVIVHDPGVPAYDKKMPQVSAKLIMPPVFPRKIEPGEPGDKAA